MGRLSEEQPKTEGNGMLPIEALHAACARNAPLEIVQTDLVGVEPFARGRMIEIESGVLIVEEVQIIGKVAKFAKQTPVVCFFRYGSRLYEFYSKVVSSEKPIHLNRSIIVPAIDFKFPTKITEGQRRNVYRIPLAALKEPITVEFWKSEPPDRACDAFTGGEDASGLVHPPTRQADWQGHMVDASDVGLGLNLTHARLSQLKLFEQAWIRFAVPGDPAGPMTFLIEIRQIRSVREGVIRLGAFIIESNDRWAHAAKVRRLWAFLTNWQRKVCRVIDSAPPGAG